MLRHLTGGEWTGPWLTARSTVIRSVGALSRRPKNIKIGITNRPRVRWLQHRQDGWDDMIVVFRSRRQSDEARLREVRQAESDLIEHLDRASRADVFHWNLRGGGGGPLSTGDQYVYMLRELR